MKTVAEYKRRRRREWKRTLTVSTNSSLSSTTYYTYRYIRLDQGSMEYAHVPTGKKELVPTVYSPLTPPIVPAPKPQPPLQQNPRLTSTNLSIAYRSSAQATPNSRPSAGSSPTASRPTDYDRSRVQGTRRSSIPLGERAGSAGTWCRRSWLRGGS